LHEAFPGLAQGGYSITSPHDKKYNCIAYAAGDTNNWWWPAPAEMKEVYWPPAVPRVETLPAFHEAFASLGYCQCTTEHLEQGFKKIAVFANAHGVPLYAARQLPSGRWTSKLGEREDIDHARRDLEGDAYGNVVLIMKRPWATMAPSG
jgi:hypothetical protein